MSFDGSLKLEGAGAGVLLISPMGKQLKYVMQIFWKDSNNEAEYEALLHGLRLAASLGIKRLLATATPQWSSTKSTSPGTTIRRTWTPTA
jgi:ribonuclease HI